MCEEKGVPVSVPKLKLAGPFNVGSEASMCIHFLILVLLHARDVSVPQFR